MAGGGAGREESERERLLEEGLGSGLGPDHCHIEDERQTFFQWCTSCCRARDDGEFTESDKDVLWHLRRRIVNSPRPSDETLHALCLTMWNTAFPEEVLVSFEVGDRWKRLGFQGKDPKTDVRTGVWPAGQLASFAQHHPKQFREIVVEAGSNGPSEYIFAITCFQISHMLAMFFDLVTFLSVAPLPGAPRASKRQLRHFTRLIADECRANNVAVNVDICQRVLDELFVEVVTKVHRSWLELVKSRPGINMMEFHIALRAGFDANAAFWESSCKDLGDLKIE